MTNAGPAAKPYDFAAPEFHLSFPVRWPNKEGRLTVTHHLRRPTFGEMIEWKRKTVIERQYNQRGESVSETAETSEADQWLWDQIALAFGGYPGMEGLVSATPEKKAQMRGTHKEQAIDYLLAAEVEILFEESTAGFDAGEWVVALKIGPNADEPLATVKLRLREWTERERREFQKKSSISRSKTEGKTTTSRYSLNLKTCAELFDALLLDAENGVADGKPLAEIGRDAFAREINGEYKVLVITQLTRHWQAALRD